MSEENTKQLKTLEIKDLDTLRAMSDPVRLQIIEQMVDVPATVKQVAKALGLTQTKLYYHINQLEEAGIIRVVNTRVVSGIIEKHYQTVAASFEINRDLLGLMKNSDKSVQIDSLLSPILETTRQEVKQLMESGQAELASEPNPGPRSVIVFRTLWQMTPEQVGKIQERLQQLIKEVTEETCNNDPATPAYAMTLAFYPKPTLTDTGPEE